MLGWKRPKRYTQGSIIKCPYNGVQRTLQKLNLDMEERCKIFHTVD